MDVSRSVKVGRSHFPLPLIDTHERGGDGISLAKRGIANAGAEALS